MVLYRFLFAPVLLAVAVLTTSPHRAPRPAPSPPHETPARLVAAPASPVRAARAVASHPATAR